MKFIKIIKIYSILLLISFFLNSCGGKLPGGDARKYPDDPKLRVKQNLEEGRGFRLSKTLKEMNSGSGGVFEFASSNELWKASLDTIDFMPLSSVNYSGGIIVTDWYSSDQNSNESVKISIRFLTNEIRSDALNLKIFYKNCDTSNRCTVDERKGSLVDELKKEILKKATLYKKEIKDKKDN